ncbi:phosphotransferase [Fulvimarina sp. MAC3]|uniref:phosphotransferase enzyme family protein n=1 Tax=Fulvimarina sp. MAC3 TaxID=3148887 RepID=UPI0031FE3FA7
MAGLYEDHFVEALKTGVRSLLGEWGLPPDAEVSLLNLSENATFLARADDVSDPIVLRVHRPNYHSLAEICSELDWIKALRHDEVASTPPALERLSGERIASFEQAGETRYVVAFGFAPGAEPTADRALEPGFERLGAISARLHDHARAWRPPEGFTRKTWRHETMLGERPLWGDWRAAMGLTCEGKTTLERTSAVLSEKLNAYGEEEDRFGLVHADLRLANLLVKDDRTTVIDFDDCGFSWFVYDFAAAISFIEEEPYIPALAEAWVRGYRTVSPLGDEHVAMIPTFVMLRRMLLTAWLASHSETMTAQELGAGYTAGTVRLAKAFLAKNGE